MKPSLKFSSSLLCGSHGTTPAHQLLPSVTDTDGVSVRVCLCVPCFLWERTQNLERGARMQRVRGDTKPTTTFSGFQKKPCSHGCNNSSVSTAVQQDQRFKLRPSPQPRCVGAHLQQYGCSVQRRYLQCTQVITTFRYSHVPVQLPNETRRRTSFYHTAVYLSQCLTPTVLPGTALHNNKQESWSRLDFLFKKMGAFYTKFSIMTPEFLVFHGVSVRSY